MPEKLGDLPHVDVQPTQYPPCGRCDSQFCPLLSFTSLPTGSQRADDLLLESHDLVCMQDAALQRGCLRALVRTRQAPCNFQPQPQLKLTLQPRCCRIFLEREKTFEFSIPESLPLFGSGKLV